MKVELLTYQARQRVRVQCMDCGDDMMTGLMAVHQKNQHDVDSGDRRQQETPPPYGEPQTHHMSFPATSGPQECLVEESRGRAATRKLTRVSFMPRHVRDTMTILLDENIPHPRFPRCNMLVPQKSLNV